MDFEHGGSGTVQGRVIGVVACPVIHPMSAVRPKRSIWVYVEDMFLFKGHRCLLVCRSILKSEKEKLLGRISFGKTSEGLT